ncbi:PE-PGRS family protein PE_PGRS30-like isoform X2 [Anabrus simplex]
MPHPWSGGELALECGKAAAASLIAADIKFKRIVHAGDSTSGGGGLVDVGVNAAVLSDNGAKNSNGGGNTGLVNVLADVNVLNSGGGGGRPGRSCRCYVCGYFGRRSGGGLITLEILINIISQGGGDNEFTCYCTDSIMPGSGGSGGNGSLLTVVLLLRILGGGGGRGGGRGFIWCDPAKGGRGIIGDNGNSLLDLGLDVHALGLANVGANVGVGGTGGGGVGGVGGVGGNCKVVCKQNQGVIGGGVGGVTYQGGVGIPGGGIHSPYLGGGGIPDGGIHVPHPGGTGIPGGGIHAPHSGGTGIAGGGIHPVGCGCNSCKHHGPGHAPYGDYHGFCGCDDNYCNDHDKHVNLDLFQPDHPYDYVVNHVFNIFTYPSKGHKKVKLIKHVRCKSGSDCSKRSAYYPKHSYEDHSDIHDGLHPVLYDTHQAKY